MRCDQSDSEEEDEVDETEVGKLPNDLAEQPVSSGSGIPLSEDGSASPLAADSTSTLR